MDPKTGEVAATDKPAQVTEQPKPAEAKMTPQYKAREEIARRVEAQRKQDMAEQKFDILTDDGEIIPADQAAKEEQGEPEVQEVVQEQLGEEAPKEEAKEQPEEMRELIVDGKKIQVPLSKILDAGVRTFQKETAADMRLAAAAELERQARERMNQLQPPPQKDAAPEVNDDDAALAKAIQFGSEEEAKAAIARLRNTSRANTQQELRQFVQGSLASDIPQHLEFYEATRWVKDEYKQLFSDPDMAQVFMNKEVAARRSGDQRPFKELYKDIADDLSDKFHLKGTTEELKAQSQDRIIRKAQAPKIAQSAAGRTSAPQEKKQATVADYVQRQRELRGLAPMPKSNQGL